MSARTIYSISHFGAELNTFRRLIDFHPNGRYCDLSEHCVAFKVNHEGTFTETWFLGDEDCAEWRGEKE